MRRTIVLAFLVLALPAWAAVEREAPADRRQPLGRGASERSIAVSPDGPSKAAGAAAAFVDRAGGDWSFRLDPRTGRFAMIQGSGIPLAGATRSASGGARRLPATAREIEPQVRAFVEAHRAWIGPERGELVFDEATSVARDDGQLLSVYYGWRVDGVPVEGATVFVRLRKGRVVQLGSRWVGPIDTETRPAVEARQAVTAALDYAGDTATARLLGEPELVLQPEDTADAGLGYRLVWKLRYKVPGRLETWEARVDAVTGSIVAFRDVNRYARAVGGVYPRTPGLTPEVEMPFSLLSVFGGMSSPTDLGGAYRFQGGVASSSLSGLYFDVNCENCSNPAQPFVQTSTGAGRLDFGLGGTDGVGNGFSTPAGRTTFFHLNLVRRLALAWLPELGWLNTPGLDANVNLAGACNAYYDGTVNFLSSSSSCVNAGQSADVVYHEWGHGLDGHTRGGDSGTGEGTADVTAMHLTRSPLIAPRFYSSGGSIRNLDWRTNPRGVMTVARVLAGDCDYLNGGEQSPHCVGEVFGQAAWDLALALVAKHGPQTGWRTSERLFFTSLPDAGSLFPDSALAIYDAYLLADDDDGDLANGTPNGAEIHEAFDRHGMASAPAISTPGCTRPEQPQPLVTETCDAVEIAWDPVVGAQDYVVLRADLPYDTALLPVGSVSAEQTTFADAQVAPGVDYRYVVMAVGADGCESTAEDPVEARLPARPLLEVSGFATDDTPRGNRSGFPDPGEEVDLTLTLTNRGESAASAVSGTLVAVTPGVEILLAQSTWPDLAPGAAGQNLAPLRVRFDESLSCGTLVQLRFIPDDAAECAGDDSWFRFALGQRVDLTWICDDTPACYEAPTFAGLESATPGASCGQVALVWQPGETACVGSALSYDVYRSTAPDFTPDAGNLLMSGLVTTGFLDTTALPGETYHYLVRAFDPRFGDDGNRVVLEVTSPTEPDLAAPQFDGLSSALMGESCGEVVLAWGPAVESCSDPVTYEIYRSTDAGFVPSPATRVASTTATTFVDAALEGGSELTYVVRARDRAGNEDGNEVRLAAQPASRDLVLLETDFESGPGGWSTADPNNATGGTWQWGNPSGTPYQPEDDATADGANCWITGLYTGPSNGDVDGGTTTLLSPPIDLSATAAPLVRYARWFTNDRGSAPGELTDRMRLDVSSDGGANWRAIQSFGAGTPLAWEQVEVALPGVVARTSDMRFRFTVADLGPDSMVEAGVDDFELIDVGQGCSGCPAPSPVGTIHVDRAGDDVVIDWSGDPAPTGTRFLVYTLDGTAFDAGVRIGSTDTRSFTHGGAMLAPQSFFYRVTGVDACGQESPLTD